MARKPRLFVDGMSYHVVNRGHNRMRCFDCEMDKRVFFKMLCEKLELFSIQLHAYVLMSNHYHLLITPTVGTEVPHFMQCLGRKYAGYFNTTNERTGTVWDGKYFASVIESDYYLLACYRYIELNPVRAGIVEDPGCFPWSSFQTNACGKYSSIISPHQTYTALGTSALARMSAYNALFNSPMSAEELRDIRSTLTKRNIIQHADTVKLVRPVPETCA
ncbi:transposase [Alishewanella sp. d11]|uniref:transposase n=1 Tax=Alishewanella sp. d11 TaxID=3414030 RepID=UPI003BF903C2